MRSRIENILEALTAGAYERDEAIALSLLSALSGESIFLLGLPGVGKSMIARRLKLAFENATVFEYLMSRFSTPDEIFGPVSIAKLKNEDCYERVTSGYLPDAEVVFLDEIWKAGPAIQNSLLTVLNEKIYLNGNTELTLPTKAIISASNELPAEGEGLEALWDRFLIRYIVEPIRRKDNFFRLIDTPAKSKTITVTPLTDAEYCDIITASADIVCPKMIKDLLYTLRTKIFKAMESQDSGESEGEQNLYVSDRRWKKAVGVLKTSAFLNGRTEINLSDTLLLDHMLWNADKDMTTLRDMLVETIVSTLFADILAQYKKLIAEAPKPTGSANEPYSPDGKHYIVQCDDFTLNIPIADFDKIKRNPQTIYMGAETTDGRLVLHDKGMYSIRYAKPGYLCLNSYNYPIVMGGSNYQQQNFFRTVSATIVKITEEFYSQIANNLFVKNSAIISNIKKTIKEYSKRFQQSEQQ